ncbi:MAG: PD-(D/E)XK nuclease family protein, partial [Pseudomonadota bacterium]
NNERVRLLYVAATRAKKRLHLLGDTPVDQKRDVVRKPRSGSLLSHLWPAVQAKFEASFARRRVQMDRQEGFKLGGVSLRRLASSWRYPVVAAPMVPPPPRPQDEEEISFHWVGSTARHVGTVVHQLLQHIGDLGIENWEESYVSRFESVARAKLTRLGVAAVELEDAVTQVVTAIDRTLNDNKGRWMLSGVHRQARCEYPLTGFLDGQFRSVILDRTFVDAAGIRWIIDYKTSRHEGRDVDAFLDNEQVRYAQQMEVYARLLQRLEQNPVRLALYFPLLTGWREWKPGQD